MFDVNMAASRAEICSGEGMLRRDSAKIGVQYEAHQFEDGTILFRCAFASALHGNLIVYRLTRFSILDNDMLIEVDNPTARWSEEGEKGEEARIAYCAPRAVRISFPERMAVQPARMEANLSNFSFGLLHEPPTPTTCTFVGREVDLVPVPNFIDTLKYLMAVSGVRQTSTLIIRDTANFTENLFSELISDILYPLTLCSSNRVSCKSYRAFDGDGGLIFACYEDARTALFTSNASSLGNTVHYREFLDAWGQRQFNPHVPYPDLRARIAQYTDCFARGAHIETRTLLCCTLLDAVTKIYCRNDPAADPKLKGDGYFGARIDHVLDALNLDQSYTAHIVKTRNSLAHSGKFDGASNTTGHYVKDYAIANWAAFAILVRLVAPSIRVRSPSDPFNPADLLADDA